MTNTIYSQLLKAIEDNLWQREHGTIKGYSKAAKACQTISEEWAKEREKLLQEAIVLLEGLDILYGRNEAQTKIIKQFIVKVKNSEHGKH